MGLLISGPAGAGKTQAARLALEQHPGPTVVADFQQLYASLLLLERDSDGRYPERNPTDAHALAMAEFLRRRIITAAVERDLFPITTNSDGDPDRRAELLETLGPGSTEQVIDPGRDVVEERLSVAGFLSAQ